MLVYGISGVGKTMLSATAPAPIVISAERGLLSLNRANQQKVFGKFVDVPVIQATTLADFEEAFRLVATDARFKSFETIVLDSISEIAEKILIGCKESNRDGRAAYGEMQDQVLDLIRRFRDLPGKHVVLLAKLESGFVEAEGANLLIPSMPGKQLTKDLPYFFDEVLALHQIKNPDGRKFRTLRAQSDLVYFSKDRSGSLDELNPPDISAIINKIRNQTP